MVKSIPMPILEYLAYRTHCEYLSDLREKNPIRLVMEIQRINPEAVSLHDWNDALNYLAEASPAKTVTDAKMDIITELLDKKGHPK